MFVPGTEKLLFPPFELQDPSSMLSRGIIQNITYSSSSFLNDPFALCASCISCRTRVSPAPLYKGHASLNRDTRRASSSASSQRWQSRQGKDRFSREARVQGLKSRAAFKLLEINERYKILKRGQTVVDLGYAPGSWLQVAVDRTAPNGRVLGIDLIPAQPPKGASTIQGNFLSPAVQAEVRKFLRDPERGRVRQQRFFTDQDDADASLSEEDLEESKLGYVDLERHASLEESDASRPEPDAADPKRQSQKAKDDAERRNVDVVLSDMSAPWEQTSGFWKRSLSAPYSRMMNTSGIPFRDHAGSMDLCTAALHFCVDTLRTGGHFVCKFYQGAEDKAMEQKLKRLFKTVHREKPESSKSTSKEAYFVALKRKPNIHAEDVFKDP